MTAAGLVFMAIAWGAILALSAWCMRRVLRNRDD